MPHPNEPSMENLLKLRKDLEDQLKKNPEGEEAQLNDFKLEALNLQIKRNQKEIDDLASMTKEEIAEKKAIQTVKDAKADKKQKKAAKAAKKADKADKAAKAS